MVVDLPAPLGPRSPNDSPGHLERQPVDGQEVGLAFDLVGLDEVLGVDDWGGHRTTLTPCADTHE
jgi:hypothetical protein